jgi:Fur family iron response transcriptional regulator
MRNGPAKGSAMHRPYSDVLDRLRANGLRPTRQRLALAKLLLERGDVHLTAEELHSLATKGGIRVSLATVYNTLHQFTEAGLLREIVVEPGCSYFDTNISDHHHFFREDTAELSDIGGADVTITKLPEPPAGMRVKRVDVVIRLSSIRKS